MYFKSKLFGLIFLVFTNFFSYSGEEFQAEKIVSNHIYKRLEAGIDYYYTVVDYYHPDIAIPPGDKNSIHVVTSHFKITNIETMKMNINLMEPIEEEICVVTVNFETLGNVEDYIFSKESLIFSRKYYLSKSTGDLLILDYSDPFWKIASIQKTLQWVDKHDLADNRWHSLHDQLSELK